ncbi:MAG: hypothetical protein VX642_12570 [Bdellovibrionota bacterium]|nr:hypothetical protein [Bdellovibrionota bacterium]
MQSLILILSIFVSSFLIHFGFRFYGYTIQYAQKRSVIFTEKDAKIYSPKLDADNYPSELEKLNSLCATKKCFLNLPTYFTSDEQLFVYQENINQYQHLGNEEIKSSDELKTAVPEVLGLRDFIVKYPNAKGLLQVNADRPNINIKLIPILAENNYYSSFVICSEFGNLLRNLREQKPHWSTCASMDELTKAHMMSSIYLESLAPMPSEYYYVPQKMINKLSKKFYEEIQRRNLFFIAPATSPVKPSFTLR